MDLSKIRNCTIVIICILSAYNYSGYGQEISDTSSFNTLFIPQSHEEDYSDYLRNSESEMNVLLSFSFLFYKEYVSTQDIEACVFHPSCSVYMMEAVEEEGTVIGVLDGLDRLLRCNLFVDKKDYPYTAETDKYHDPH